MGRTRRRSRVRSRVRRRSRVRTRGRRRSTRGRRRSTRGRRRGNRTTRFTRKRTRRRSNKKGFMERASSSVSPAQPSAAEEPAPAAAAKEAEDAAAAAKEAQAARLAAMADEPEPEPGEGGAEGGDASGRRSDTPEPSEERSQTAMKMLPRTRDSLLTDGKILVKKLQKYLMNKQPLSDEKEKEYVYLYADDEIFRNLLDAFNKTIETQPLKKRKGIIKSYKKSYKKYVSGGGDTDFGAWIRDKGPHGGSRLIGILTSKSD